MITSYNAWQSISVLLNSKYPVYILNNISLCNNSHKHVANYKMIWYVQKEKKLKCGLATHFILPDPTKANFKPMVGGLTWLNLYLSMLGPFVSLGMFFFVLIPH